MSDHKHEHVELEELYRKYPNKFELTVAVSKRARQIKEGSKPLIESNTDQVIPVISAIHELKEDKVEVIHKDYEEVEELLGQFDKELEEELGEEFEEDVKEATQKKVRNKKSESEKKNAKSKSLSA